MSLVHIFSALLTTGGSDPSTGIQNLPTGSASTTLTNILNIVYFVAGITAVIVIIIAGYTYVTSGGKAASITKAKDAILFSVIGLIVIMVAFVITQFVVGRF